MFVLTDKKTGGVYANSKSGDEQGKKNVLVFAEKDDAERYIHKHLLRKTFRDKYDVNFYETNY